MKLTKYSKDEPNLFRIEWKGEFVGSLVVAPSGDTLLIQELNIPRKGIVRRDFLVSLEDSLDTIAKRRGYLRVGIMARGPREKLAYIKAGYAPSEDFGPYVYEKDLFSSDMDDLLDSLSSPD